jgi:uncharacterized protein YndB with AHSA1/START domain
MTEQQPADQFVNITRAFTAPRDVVWKFWTQPKYLAQWFGPDGFHVPVESVDIDLRVGGRWNLVMVDDATGDEHAIKTTITELIDSELLVGSATANTADGPITVTLRAQFHDHGDITRLTFTQGPFTTRHSTETAQGWEMSWVKLDTILKGAPA